MKSINVYYIILLLLVPMLFIPGCAQYLEKRDAVIDRFCNMDPLPRQLVGERAAAKLNLTYEEFHERECGTKVERINILE